MMMMMMMMMRMMRMMMKRWGMMGPHMSRAKAPHAPETDPVPFYSFFPDCHMSPFVMMRLTFGDTRPSQYQPVPDDM